MGMNWTMPHDPTQGSVSTSRQLWSVLPQLFLIKHWVGAHFHFSWVGRVKCTSWMAEHLISSWCHCEWLCGEKDEGSQPPRAACGGSGHSESYSSHGSAGRIHLHGLFPRIMHLYLAAWLSLDYHNFLFFSIDTTTTQNSDSPILIKSQSSSCTLHFVKRMSNGFGRAAICSHLLSISLDSTP